MRTRMKMLTLALLLPGSLLAATPGNSLKWKVSETKALYGFIVYRSENREGPFVRANSTIIRARKDDGTANQGYVFEDTDVISGKPYYYFIDAIGDNGRKKRLTGVQSKKGS